MVRRLGEGGAAARTSVCPAVDLGVWWLLGIEPQDQCACGVCVCVGCVEQGGGGV